MRRIALLSFYCFLFINLVFSVQGLAQKGMLQPIAIAFYNLENLYDTINDPNVDDEEFLPQSPLKWTNTRYRHKLVNQARVIASIGNEETGSGPAIIGLAEVENRQVLEDLIHTPPLDKSGYAIIHFDSPDQRGIDVALLYNPRLFKPLSTTSNRLKVSFDSAFRTRDQLVVTGKLAGKTLSVIVNHWPSRRSKTEYRAAAARLTKHLCDSLMQHFEKASIVVMGDLNDDPADSSVSKVLGARASVDELGSRDLYNPMWQLLTTGTGSLQYRGVWNLFDQIIVSEAMVNPVGPSWKFLKAGVFKADYMFEQQGKYAGCPLRTFAGKNYLGGYSDHLPAYIILSKQK